MGVPRGCLGYLSYLRTSQGLIKLIKTLFRSLNRPNQGPIQELLKGPKAPKGCLSYLMTIEGLPWVLRAPKGCLGYLGAIKKTT